MINRIQQLEQQLESVEGAEALLREAYQRTPVPALKDTLDEYQRAVNDCRAELTEARGSNG